MKITVVYKSRTGFTKQYAEWIAAELDCEARQLGDLNADELNTFDVVIYGSRVHAGIIDGVNKMQALYTNKNGRLIIFATGATPADATDVIAQLWKKNLKSDNTAHFYFQSGLRYEKMGLADKSTMKLLAAFLSRKKDKSETENGTSDAISQSYDISSKAYIAPLIEYVRRLEV